MYRVTLKTFPSPPDFFHPQPSFSFRPPQKTSIITHNLVALVLVFYRPASLKGLEMDLRGNKWMLRSPPSFSFFFLFAFASLSPQFFLLCPLPFLPISLLFSSFSLPFPKLNIWKSSCYQSLLETELVTFKLLKD